TYLYRLKQVDLDGAFEYSDEIEVTFAAPNKYQLEQNYPNPFNPVTSIKFSIPQSGQVSLKVFNTLGEEVANLLNNKLEAGYHTIEFDASMLSSGIYFYRLSSNNFVAIKKMLLLK
ncbi:MAG: T9SS type A sorting domain-containing protein, partial [Melioribacteraceae bacterium]|nr:T9SS type A sorting domain-containing protein [Melioribacteraceae bacterium]